MLEEKINDLILAIDRHADILSMYVEGADKVSVAPKVDSESKPVRTGEAVVETEGDVLTAKEVKAELDALGITYGKKAGTPALLAKLKRAKEAGATPVVPAPPTPVEDVVVPPPPAELVAVPVVTTPILDVGIPVTQTQTPVVAQPTQVVPAVAPAVPVVAAPVVPITPVATVATPVTLDASGEAVKNNTLQDAIALVPAYAAKFGEPAALNLVHKQGVAKMSEMTQSQLNAFVAEIELGLK